MKFCSTEIEYTTLNVFKNYLNTFSNKSIVVILSLSGRKRWALEDSIANLSTKNKVVSISNKIENPSQLDILDAISQIDLKPDFIIAIGGGSSIDLAKGISAIYSYSKDFDFSVETISAIILDKLYIGNSSFIDIVAVPTTAGTGSEVTQWGTIWDYKNKDKMSIDCEGLKPKTAIIISEFIYTLPNKILLSTSLDALSHAMESFWAKASNDLIKDIALRAIELIADNLQLALVGEIQAKDCLVRASVIAGLSFSQTRTTACHAISYPLTAIYGIEHGIAVAMTLNAVLNINRIEVARIKEMDAIFAQYDGFNNWLVSITKNITSLRLSHYGIKETDIMNLTKRCSNKARMENNPVILNENNIYKILIELL